MLTILGINFWAYFLYFLIAVFLAFFIPGNLILKKKNLSKLSVIVLSLILGMVLWSWQGILFGFLKIRWLTYFYLVLSFIWWFKINLKTIQSLKYKKLKIKDFDFLIFLIIFLGVLIQLISTLLVGVLNNRGIYFCCSLPDSLYHLALTNQLIKSVPPIEPGASGILVQNYHYWSNLLVADLVRIFHLPLIATSFQYMVLFFSILFGLSATVFAKIINLDQKAIYWLLFFLYFSGDITFFLLFLLGKGFNFSLPMLENGAWIWISPPRVMAAAIFFGFLSLFAIWVKKKEFYWGLLLALIAGSLIGFKIYMGIFTIAGLFVLGIYYLLKKNFLAICSLVLMGTLSLVVYLLANGSAGGVIFTGFWRFQDFIVSPIFNLSHLELERQIYWANTNWPRIIEYSLIYALLYFLFVFGTLNLGFLQTRKTLNFLGKEINIFLISAIIISLILGSFFIQQTGGANSSQFLITMEIVISIYAALAVYYWTAKLRGTVKFLVIILIIILTSSRVGYQTWQNLQDLSRGKGLTISSEELQALDFLREKTSPQSLILINNVDKGHWSNANSYYISFLSDRQIFVDGKGIALDHGVKVEDKILATQSIFESSNSALVKRLLKDNKIDYLYMGSNDNLVAKDINFLIPVFQNQEVKVLKVEIK